MSLIWKLFRLIAGSPSNEDRELADDEEERIFYDPEMGKSRVEMVKKTPGRLAVEKEAERLREEEESRYPKSDEVKFRTAPAATFQLGEIQYSLRKLHAAEEHDQRLHLKYAVPQEEACFREFAYS